MSSYNIVAVSTGLGGSFYVTGNLTAYFTESTWFNVIGSSGNNGQYVVKTSQYLVGPGQTRIDVITSQNVPSLVADGQIYVLGYRAYKINFRDPAKPTFFIAPQTIDVSHTSLSLAGQGKFDYGEIMDENLVNLLENFARDVAPGNPIEGQLWYDTSLTPSVLKIFDGSTFGMVNATALADLYVDVTGDNMSGRLIIDTTVANDLNAYYNVSGEVLGMTDSHISLDADLTFPIGSSKVVPNLRFSENGKLRFHVLYNAGATADTGNLHIDRNVKYVGNLLLGSLSMGATAPDAVDTLGMKVGVGTDAPQHKFHVESNEEVISQFENSNNSSATVRITNNNSSKNWDVAVSGTSHATVSSGKLFIKDSSSGVARIEIGTDVQINGNSDASFVLKDGSTTRAAKLLGGNDGSGGYFRVDTGDVGGTYTERMRITSSGKVGMGTSLPVERLEVSNTGTTRMFLNDTSNLVTAQIGSYSGGVVVGSATNHNVIIRTNDVERMRIDTSGNVGIGATPVFGAINNGLEIKNSGAKVGIRLETTAGSTGVLEIYAESGISTIDGRGSPIRFNNSTTELVRIDVNGNVGIGITPTVKLDVNGSVRFRTTAQLDGDTTISGNVFIAGGSSKLSIQDGTNSNPSIFFANDSDTGFIRVSSGSIGIVGNGVTIAEFYGAPTSYHDMKNHRLSNVSTPTSGNDATNKTYVDNIALNNFSVLSGTVGHGGTIPLPSGFTQAQCKWFVSINTLITGVDDTPAGHTTITSFCSADSSRVVSCYSTEVNSNYSTVTNYGTANYMIIGIK